MKFFCLKLQIYLIRLYKFTLQVELEELYD